MVFPRTKAKPKAVITDCLLETPFERYSMKPFTRVVLRSNRRSFEAAEVAEVAEANEVAEAAEAGESGEGGEGGKRTKARVIDRCLRV
mmetsp:Transcript_8155/g.12685  ORF Transcript_8155/g.12685 Transcript_8155/m.12685 type:complete len:88 (-) Transcript_8155:187-450(-)